MTTVRDVLSDIILAQVNDLDAVISDKVLIDITCTCGLTKKISTRALKRKWAGKSAYLCKSCHIKTYASDPGRIAKFKESFSKVSNTPEHKKKCSEAGKKPWKNPETRAKIIEAVRYDNKTNPLKKLARKTAIKALKNKPWFKEHMANMRLSQRGKPSILENIIAQLLDDNSIQYIRQYQLGCYSYDFLVKPEGSSEFLLEVQGEYWHTNSCAKDSAKATYAASVGYDIHHIWEHEFSSIGSVISRINQWSSEHEVVSIPFKLNNVVVRRIETYDARVFLGAYHYLPAISKFGYHVGAYLGDDLIAVCTYSSITRKESATRLGLVSKKVRELSRFCIHPSRHQKNFGSWLLSRAVKLFKLDNPIVEMLISFADTTHGHVGTIYKAANWSFDGTTKPSYMYIADTGHTAHKKTIWDRAKKLSISESEYAKQNGYVKLIGKSKNRFVLSL